MENNNIKIDEFIEFNKEPISHDAEYYSNPETTNPNEYIKFQQTNNVISWRKKEIFWYNNILCEILFKIKLFKYCKKSLKKFLLRYGIDQNP